MGPRVQAEPDLGPIPLAVAVLDPTSRRVLTLRGAGRGADETDIIEGLELAVLSAPYGREIARERGPAPTLEGDGWSQPRVHPSAEGFALDWWRVDRGRREARGAFEPDAVPRIEASQDGARVVLVPAEPEVSLTRRGVRIGAREIPLAPEHAARSRGDRVLQSLLDGRGTRWVLTIEQVDLGTDGSANGAVALSRIDPGATESTLVRSARGAGAMRLAPDGALLAQLGPRLFRVTRDGAPEPLPEGLVLVPSSYPELEIGR